MEEETEVEEPVVEEPQIDWSAATSVWTTTDLNLREQPNTDCKVLTTFARGTELKKASEENGWAYIQCGDYEGYVSMKYIANEKPNVLKVEGLHIDLEFKRCTVDGKEVKLTRKEFELLAYLISHRGKICSREQILSRVWSNEVVVLDRTIDVNITRLRSKIGAYGSYIVTRSGFGYGFRD